MLSVRMRFVLLMIFIYAVDIQAASIKKSISESALKTEIPTKPSKHEKAVSSKSKIPAIVAIEIIDAPKDSSTPKNTSKRTIESSLGYGYHSPFAPEPPKKFVIYKYSQHDIPPYNPHKNGGYNNQATIQKSIGYHLGTTTHVQHQPSVQVKQPQPVYQAPVHSQATQYQHPGTTLYTTLSDQGHLGGLSNDVPYQDLGHAGMVPVIILRVYTNQLDSPDTALHTNLPQAHPYSNLNNVNLQSLLQNYVQQYIQSQSVAHYPMQQLYTAPDQAYHQYYPVSDEYHSSLPTSENYPSDSHTRVIFHSNNNGHIPELPKIMYKTAGLSTYKTPELPTYKVAEPNYVEVQTPDSQYAYASGAQNLEQGYMYVYPNQLDQSDQDVYYQQYQQDNQNYQEDVGYSDNSAHTPSGGGEEPTKPPFNYHAHPSGSSPKQRRSKKNTLTISPTLSPKRRVPRDKTT